MNPAKASLKSAPVAAPETVAYTQEDLQAMTIAQIKALASEQGYTITKTRKDEIIQSRRFPFL